MHTRDAAKRVDLTSTSTSGRVWLAALRCRAYSRAQFERLVAESAFRICDIQREGIGMEVRLKKRGTA
jgi:hypothetical protein